MLGRTFPVQNTPPERLGHPGLVLEQRSVSRRGLTGVYQGCNVRVPMKQIKMALTDRQIKTLKKEAVTLGISFSELIRRILDRHLDSKQ